MIGIAILAIPRLFALYGVITTSLLLFISMLLHLVSNYLLRESVDMFQAKSWVDLCEKSGGKTLKALFYGISITKILLTNTSMVIIEARLLNFFCLATNIADLSAHYDTLVLVLVSFIFFPISLFQLLNAYRIKATIFFILLFICLLIVLFSLPSYLNSPSYDTKSINWYTTDLDKILMCFSVLVMAFFYQFNAITVYMELRDPSAQRMDKVHLRAQGFAFILYFLIGIAAYFSTLD